MHAVRCIAASLVILTGIARGADERPRRTTMPIGTSWNLTAEKHERTVTDGKRTKLLTSTGKPVLKHGANVIKGPWDIEAKAAKIECDFVAKKFVLSGDPVLQRLDPATGKVSSTIIAKAPATTITVAFDGKNITWEGRAETTFTTDAPAAPAR